MLFNVDFVDQATKNNYRFIMIGFEDKMGPGWVI